MPAGLALVLTLGYGDFSASPLMVQRKCTETSSQTITTFR
jgi:hypothetical protein